MKWNAMKEEEEANVHLKKACALANWIRAVF
jgi:hypothetical protein